MEPSVEYLFSVKAMVHGHHEYFRAGVKFQWALEVCLLPSSDVESRSLPTHALAEEISEDGIFSLNSPFGSGRDCLPVVLNLKYFNNTIHTVHTYVYHIYSNY